MLSTTHTTIKRFFILIAAIILLNSCSKEKGQCWDVYTSNGSLTKTVCGQTEELIRNVYGKYYDKASATKYCWQAIYPGYFIYYQNLSEKMAGLFFSDALSYSKVSCEFCQNWEYYIKYIYKPTGEYFNSVAKAQTLCGDTCLTLYPGREIIIRETVDTLVKTIFKYKLP